LVKKKTTEELEAFGEKVRRKDRKMRRNQILLVIPICLLLFIGYKWVKGDFKFLLHSTKQVNAVVTNTEMYNIGYEYYRQNVTYEFRVRSKLYIGENSVGKIKGKKTKGSSLLIKYAIDDPTIHEIVE